MDSLGAVRPSQDELDRAVNESEPAARVPMIEVGVAVEKTRQRRAKTRGFMARSVNSVRRRPEARGFWIRVIMPEA